ncbi:MAG: PEP-CTERM sorting domain-containing protein [Cytophagales bacterium]|nr:PEP-CTERM sorting domain-containing protein [Armatimonadota bacterium]
MRLISSLPAPRRALSRTTFGAALLCGASLLLFANPAAAQIEIIDEHIDIGTLYEGGVLSLIADNDDTGEEFTNPAADLLFVLGDNAQTPRNASPQFDFIGTGAGQPTWVSAGVDTAGDNLPLIGLAAESVSSGLFADDAITISLLSYVGPGQFSGYYFDSGSLIVAFATANGITAADQGIVFAEDEHQDYFMTFTAPGSYSLTFQASGTLLSTGGLVTSSPTTYNFRVGTLASDTAAPEPGSLALIGFAALGGIAYRHRRRAAK